MSKKLVVKLVHKEIIKLKATPEVQGYLDALAQPRTPEGCEAKHWTGDWTTTVVIHPVTKKAEKDNLENNTLLKSLGR